MKEQKRFYKHKITNFLTVGKIVTVHYQQPEKGYVSKTESHDFWEINYADKGEFLLSVDGIERTVKQGEIFFIPPNKPHFLRCENNEPNIFIVSFDCRLDGAFFSNMHYLVPEEIRYLLQNLVAEAKDTFYIPDFNPDLNKLETKKDAKLGSEQVIKNSLELFLIYLLRDIQNQHSPQEFFVSKIQSSTALQDEIVSILSEHLYSSLSLDELCARLHYGKTYLCTFFRKKTGMSIYQTYLKLKTDEAKKLIRRKVPFVEIAQKLNFDSVPHFNAIFKKYTGMTPGEYKNSII